MRNPSAVLPAILALTLAGTLSPTAGGALPEVASGSPSTPARTIVPATRSVVYLVTGRHQRGLRRSVDGGRTFVRTVAPRARSRRGHRLPLATVVFTGARHGFALLGRRWNHDVLEETTDGARSWHRAAIGSSALAILAAGRHAYAAGLTCRSAVRCLRLRLYRRAPRTGAWRQVAAAGVRRRNLAGGLGVDAWGHVVWLTVGNGTRDRGPLLLRSTDAGRRFHRVATIPAESCQPRPTSRCTVWLDCSDGMSSAAFRAQAGLPLRRLPLSGAGTGGIFFDAVSDRVAYVGTEVGQGRGLFRSLDGGRRLHRHGDLPPGARRAVSTPDVAFCSEADGLGIVNGRLFHSSDGGIRWRRVELR